MNDKLNKPEHGDSMESFFDNLMSEQEAAEFLAQYEHENSFKSQWDLQKQIDASLKDLFHFELPTETAVESTHTQRDSFASQRRRMIQLVLAASLVGVLCWFGWKNFNSGPNVVYQSKPLAQIYHETVGAGFEPYYLCEDMERFAATFNHRHGVAVTLTKMPEDRSMLGLSYMGGVSREATAMLCTVQHQPVLVLVDNVYREPENMPASNDPDLNIFRAEKFGLVFYEVTPLDQPTMTQYFELVDEAAKSE